MFRLYFLFIQTIWNFPNMIPILNKIKIFIGLKIYILIWSSLDKNFIIIFLKKHKFPLNTITSSLSRQLCFTYSFSIFFSYTSIADDQLPNISLIDLDNSTLITEILLNDETTSVTTSDNPSPPSTQKQPFNISLGNSFSTCYSTTPDVHTVKSTLILLDNPSIDGSTTVPTSDNLSSPSPQRQPFPTSPKTPFQITF